MIKKIKSYIKPKKIVIYNEDIIDYIIKKSKFPKDVVLEVLELESEYLKENNIMLEEY